jgi:hypothetical protein
MPEESAGQRRSLGTARGPHDPPAPGEAAASSVDKPAPSQPTEGGERRRAATACAWCGKAIEPKARGRIPKWCSASCRQRAWEQARAASSGRSAVQVVERRVETPVPIRPTRSDWPRLLNELTAQLDDGRIYNRDLDDLSVAVNKVLDAMARRTYIRSRTAPRPH